VKIALTGATGFIGRCISSLLLHAGHQVRALVRDSTAASRLLDPRVDLLDGDLVTGKGLDALTQCADAVMHIAGSVRGARAEDFDEVNIGGTRRLLEAMEHAGQRTPLLFFSSLAAREPALSHYARSKAGAENLIARFRGEHPACIFRPPAVYGPGDREMLPVFRFMKRVGLAPVAGRADARTSLIFVDDLARAALAWLEHGRESNDTYTLHDGHQGGYDWYELAAAVSEVAGRPVRVWQIPEAPLDLVAACNRALSRVLGYHPMLTPEKLCELRHPDWSCDNSAISTALGWKPTVELVDGLRLTPGWLGG